jgi:phosphatidate cytidylyltransferase
VLARVLSGITFVPVLILAARAGGAWFLLLVNWILAAATWEFYGLMEAKGVHPSKKVGIFASLALAVVVYTTGLEHLGLFLSAFVLTILVRELFRAKLAFPIYDIATTVFGVVYVGWLLTHLILIRELPRSIGLPDLLGAHLVLYSILIVWSCDTGAFLFGILFGRHKLLPHVSPGKSVEGAAAGFLCAVGGALWGRAWFAHYPDGAPLLSLGQAIVLGCLLGIAGQLGDLVESLLKRDARVKDASSTIPGHGGVLDRFDSLLFSAPVAYYYLRSIVFAR